MKMTRNEYILKLPGANAQQRAALEALEIEIEEPEYPTKCEKCGGEALTWHKGYPGEEILICDDCDTPVYADFDISMVL
jgi:hypothetical protein